MKRLPIALSLLVTVSGVPAEVRYRVTPLCPPAGVDAFAIAALGLNNRAEVVGEYGMFRDDEFGESLRAFSFSSATNTLDLGWQPDWVTSAVGINNAGQIAVYGSEERPVKFSAFRYTPGFGFEPLGSFGGEQTETEAINEAGQVTGFSEGPDGRSYVFRYTDGIGMENIGTNFAITSRGFAINDQGWVAGYGDGYAFLYRDDEGVINVGPGRAYGINNTGSVVGVSWVSPNDRAFVYKNGTLTIVGPDYRPYYFPETILLDINNRDVAVGIGWGIYPQDGNKSGALLWNEADGLVRLNSLITEDSGWWLTTAAAINDRGQIVGSGTFQGKNLAYRLDPVPPLLSIARGITNAMVSWSPAWPGIVLESATDLTVRDWQPVETGGTNAVSLPVSGPARFFRLNLDGIRGLCCVPDELEK